MTVAMCAGVAFSSLQGQQLFPMVCSTAAQSAMRVTYSVSHPVDLKLLSLQAIRNDAHLMGQLALVPGLRRFLASTWWIASGMLPSQTFRAQPDYRRPALGRDGPGGLRAATPRP